MTCWWTCCRCWSARASVQWCCARTNRLPMPNAPLGSFPVTTRATHATTALCSDCLPGRRTNWPRKCSRNSSMKGPRYECRGPLRARLGGVRQPRRARRRGASKRSLGTRRADRAGHQPGCRRHGDHRPDCPPSPRHFRRDARDRPVALRNPGADTAHRTTLRPARREILSGAGNDCPFRQEERRRRDAQERRFAQGVLPHPQTRAAGPLARWVERLGHRPAPRTVKHRGGVPFHEIDDQGRIKLNPLADWSWADVWHYIDVHQVPYNPLHDQFMPSIGCAPCTRAIAVGEPFRSGRWWWEDDNAKECGLHVNDAAVSTLGVTA